MVTVTSRIPESKYDEIVSLIQSVVRATPSLTPRSEYQLRTALQSHTLAVAYHDGEVVGWLLATPYGATTQELGMAYIAPEHRHAGILHNLIGELIEGRPVSVAVTYEIGLKRTLMEHWAFEPSTLREFIRVSRGRFLLNRLVSIKSMGAVRTHTSEKKPLFLIKRVR